MERDDSSWHGDACEIRVCDESIRVYRSGSDELLWHLRWDEVQEIAVWKWDLFAVDRICMGFAWSGSDQLKRVDEEMRGWKELLNTIEHRYRIGLADWWEDVVVPAFAQNYKIIWKKGPEL